MTLLLQSTWDIVLTHALHPISWLLSRESLFAYVQEQHQDDPLVSFLGLDSHAQTANLLLISMKKPNFAPILGLIGYPILNL